MVSLWQKIADILRLSRLEKRWQKAARILAIIVVFCTTYMLILPAITVEKETYCGITDESHIHSEGCYIMPKPELGPDGETAEIWEKTLEDIEFTQSGAENVLAVAASQLGYKESELNCILDDKGVTQGYTRYGQWYGNPYGNWNGMFVSFCLYYGGLEDAEKLIASSALGLHLQWTDKDLYESADTHTVKEGEIAFFDKNGDGEADSVGIVSEIDEDSVIKVIIGDSEGAVAEITLEDKGQIMGYGLTGEVTVKSTEEETTAEEVTETIAEETVSETAETTEEPISAEKATEHKEEATTEETLAEEATTEETATVAETTTEVSTTEVTTTEETTTEATTTEVTTTEALSTNTTTENITEDEMQKEIEKYSANLDKDTLSALDELSEEDRNLVLKMLYINSLLPTLDEFYEELDRLYELDDTEGEEEYIKEIHNKFSYAYCLYQCLDELQIYFTETEKLFELKDFFVNLPQTYVSAETGNIQFNFINYRWYNANNNAWDDTLITPIISHGGTVSETVGTAVNRFWWGFVVEYNSQYDYYYVDEIYVPEGSSASNNDKILALESDTAFVLLIWMADGGTTQQRAAAAIAQTVEVNDRVNISIDPTTVSSGYKSAGYGTISFDVPFVEPTTEPPTTEPDEPDEPVGDPVIEDIPLSDITDGELSDTQVKDAGGKTTSAEGDVEISKSIDGTDIENVFDITLTVRTESSMQTYLADPDMAVVIVMDISNTMNSKYPAGSTTSRYDAAVVAAENFINQFAEKGQGISKLGFVAFNTHAHEIIELQACTTANAPSLISEMKTDTKAIISASGYASSHDRFTNIEAGLKMGYDMLDASGNENKYIVFLSDGFPTTYLKTGTTTYQGYDPYTPSGTKGSDGVFYDYVKGYYCDHGTSYSDKAAIRAREIAEAIKSPEMGATIFSIGVDVSGQNIYDYEYTDAEYASNEFSIIDRTSTNYEIGDESLNGSEAYEGLRAFEYWLKYSIGSSYYYDSNNQTQITEAFNNIFTAIENMNKESRETIWTTTDPLPVLGEDASVVEFINFFDKDGNAVYDVDEDEGFEYLDGEFGVGLENTAFHKDDTIYWDLKDSGYTTDTSEDGNTTYFYYRIKYRIRLYNENAQFVEHITYNTNGDAYLEYKTITTVNDVTTVSENKKLYFEKPAVEGYYENFEFFKQSNLGNPLEGAVFTLTHDDEACPVCHGNGKPVTTVSKLGPFTSEADGSVSFPRIPSGHIYILKETVVPEGYMEPDKIYKVTVAMDELSVRIYESEEDTVGTPWSGDGDFTLTNRPYTYVLPETGGTGTYHLYIIGGLLIILSAVFLLCLYKNDRGRRRKGFR